MFMIALSCERGTLYCTGGTLVIACWCQREETAERPLTKEDKERLQFLYDEWAHPFFISIEDFGRLMEVRLLQLASPRCGQSSLLLRMHCLHQPGHSGIQNNPSQCPAPACAQERAGVSWPASQWLSTLLHWQPRPAAHGT